METTRLIIAAKRILAWNEKHQQDLHMTEDPYGTCWTATQDSGIRANAMVELRLALEALSK